MKIRPIILASGNSERFQENKLLYPLNGKPIVCHIMDELLLLVEKKLVQTPFVVTQYHEIVTLGKERNFIPLWNDFANKGISESIKIGVASAEHTDAYLFLTADQPYLKANVLEGFIAGFIDSKKDLGCVTHQEQMGSPTIFKKKYQDELRSLTGDVGGKNILHQNKNALFLYPVDTNVVKDIDKKTDLLL
ncbi:MAG: nucleotidyltransferase family protein [Anaerotignum sp.]